MLSSCLFLHHSSDAPSPFAVQCAIPATACITVLPHHPWQFSVLLFLPLPVSQVCPFTIASSVCYSCHCLYHSSASSPLPVQCATPATACIRSLPLHPLPVQCATPATVCITARPFTIAGPVGNTCHCLCHSIAPTPLPAQCAIPAASCITAMLFTIACPVGNLPLHASELCPLSRSVQCSIPATLCIIVMGIPHLCQFSFQSLPPHVSQPWECPITASSVLHHCHCLYHSNGYAP